MREKVDVVIVTKGEASLPLCIRSVRKRVPVNNLILVSSVMLKDKLSSLSDIYLEDVHYTRVGEARAIGLQKVETEYHCSIDSDVIINPAWYKWCIKTIKKTDVGACQGFAKPVAKIYGPALERYYRKKGTFCCLGNTMLKTEVVRKVGMPPSPNEDGKLKQRIEELGLKWISNIELASWHLISDVDIWKHSFRWARKGGGESNLTNIKEILIRLSPIGLRFNLNENLHHIANRLFIIVGRITKGL